jgi:hypothetical protein
MLTVESTTYGIVGSCCCKEWVAIKHGCMRTCFPLRIECPGPILVPPTDPVKPNPPPINIDDDDDYPPPVIGARPTLKVSECLFEVLGMFSVLPEPTSPYVQIKAKKLVVRCKCTAPKSAIGSIFTFACHIIDGNTRTEVICQPQKLFPAITFTASSPEQVMDYVIWITREQPPANWDHSKWPCCYLSTGAIDFLLSAVSGQVKGIPSTAANTTGPVLAQRISQ